MEGWMDGWIDEFLGVAREQRRYRNRNLTGGIGELAQGCVLSQAAVGTCSMCLLGIRGR